VIEEVQLQGKAELKDVGRGEASRSCFESKKYTARKGRLKVKTRRLSDTRGGGFVFTDFKGRKIAGQRKQEALLVAMRLPKEVVTGPGDLQKG